MNLHRLGQRHAYGQQFVGYYLRHRRPEFDDSARTEQTPPQTRRSQRTLHSRVSSNRPCRAEPHDMSHSPLRCAVPNPFDTRRVPSTYTMSSQAKPNSALSTDRQPATKLEVPKDQPPLAQAASPIVSLSSSMDPFPHFIMTGACEWSNSPSCEARTLLHAECGSRMLLRAPGVACTCAHPTSKHMFLFKHVLYEGTSAGACMLA